MILSEKHKFIYLDPPKTATVTLSRSFIRHYGGKQIDRHNTKIPDNIDHTKYIKIISVRHPYSRLLSHRNFYIRKFNGNDPTLGENPSIDKWIAVCLEYADIAETFAQCYKFVEDCGFDYIIKQEHIIEGFKNLPFVNKPFKLGYVHKAPKPTDISILTDKQKYYKGWPKESLVSYYDPIS